MKEALLALERALLIRLIYPVTSVRLPLQPDYRKSPKLQVVDTGLINHVSGLKKELFGARVIDAVYEGRIAEHIVGQELISLSGSLLQKEKFWIRQKESDAEVDYLFAFNQMVIPIEVKSGGSGKLRSLHEFMDRTNHQYAIRIFSEKLSVTRSRTRNGKDYYLLNLPFFLIHRIEDYLGWLVSEYV